MANFQTVPVAPAVLIGVRPIDASALPFIPAFDFEPGSLPVSRPVWATPAHVQKRRSEVIRERGKISQGRGIISQPSCEV